MEKWVAGKYRLMEQNRIGSGNNGEVYKWGQYAIKVIRFNQEKGQQFLKAVEEMKNQVQFLKQFNHQNIVKWIDFIQEDNKFYLITQLCERTLMEKSKARKEQEERTGQNLGKVKFSEAQALQKFTQILKGYNYLYKHRIFHRDIKPANILISKEVVKLADFGFSKKIQDFNTQLCQTRVGTWPYSSPQILRNQQYTSKSDVWSLGIVLYQMISGSLPFFASNSPKAVLDRIMSQKVPIFKNMKISQDTKQLILQMLKIDQKQRISFEELFQKFEVTYNVSPKKTRIQIQTQRLQQSKVNLKLINTLRNSIKKQENSSQIKNTQIKLQQVQNQNIQLFTNENVIILKNNSPQQAILNQQPASTIKVQRQPQQQQQFQIKLIPITMMKTKDESTKNESNSAIVYLDVEQNIYPSTSQYCQFVNQQSLKQRSLNGLRKDKMIKQEYSKIKQIFATQRNLITKTKTFWEVENQPYQDMSFADKNIFQKTLEHFNDNFKQSVRLVYSTRYFRK